MKLTHQIFGNAYHQNVLGKPDEFLSKVSQKSYLYGITQNSISFLKLLITMQLFNKAM